MKLFIDSKLDQVMMFLKTLNLDLVVLYKKICWV